MIFSFNNGKRITTALKPSVVTVATPYTISYVANLEAVTDTYFVLYDSEGRVETVNTYNVIYTSLYGDAVTKYTIKYYSGVELTDRSTRYSLKYTTTSIESFVTPYTIRYDTTGIGSNSYRTIYKLKYSSAASMERIDSYTLRYTHEFFRDRSNTYKITYTSSTPFTFEVNAVLVRNSSSTGVLFCIRGSTDKLGESLFVFSNLPKYQLVQFDTETVKTNVTFLNVDSIKPYNLFNESLNLDSELQPCAYILVKGVEETNSLSLDIYDKYTLDKINKSKSFFFDIDSNNFITNPTSLSGTTYGYVNYTSDYYNYNYLNFVEKTLVPIFRLSDSCCFAVKINDTTKGGTLCSPF